MSGHTLHLLPLGEKEERILVRQLCEGVPEAYEALYHRFVGRVLGLSRQLLRDPAGAEDATQETFLRIYRNIHRFRGDARLSTWIHRIATNVCLTQLDRRKRRTERARERREAVRDELGQHCPPSGEMAVSLTQVLGRLEPRKQVTFYLCHVEGMSAAEIAEVLEESRAAVLKRLQRTRQELLVMWGEVPDQARKSGQTARGAS